MAISIAIVVCIIVGSIYVYTFNICDSMRPSVLSICVIRKNKCIMQSIFRLLTLNPSRFSVKITGLY